MEQGNGTGRAWSLTTLTVMVAIVLRAAVPTMGQSGPGGEWRYYWGDNGAAKYSPLDQINKDNVKDLQVVWRWKAQNFGPSADYNWEATPLMANGVLYITAGTHRDGVATRRPARLSPSSSSRPARPE